MVAARRYQQHPLGQLVSPPSMDDREQIRKSLSEHGWQAQNNDIILHEGKILDGWTRYQECGELDLTPTFAQFQGDDPCAFVARMNLSRRHLNTPQRLRVAEGMRPHLEEEASRRRARQPAANGNGRVNEQIARLAQTSPRQAANFHTVETNGSAELRQAVQDEDISISAAAAIASTQTKTEQNETVRRVRRQATPRERRRTARSAAANGKPVYDDRKITKAIEDLAKMFDARANALKLGLRNEGRLECVDKLNGVLASWTRWQKETAT